MKAKMHTHHTHARVVLAKSRQQTLSRFPAKWKHTHWLCVCGSFLLAGSAPGATFRYAVTSNRIYVENGGSATLTDIKAELPAAPLDLVDAANKVWMLRADLFVTDGSKLVLRGAAAGGDVNELRLLSNNSAATNSVVMVDADAGTLDLHSTRVTSWDEAASGPDTENEVYQRAFIRARSRQAGTTNQESTLNVTNSDIGYLGFKDSQSYGLTWQVVGSVAGVRVFGAVSGSRIHHCELGAGTWSVDDVSWTGNEIDHNTLNNFNSADAGHQAVLANNNVHDNEYPATFRWSSTSQRIYVTGPGSGTLSEMKAALPSAPITLVDPANRIWYLGADVFVENGARLKLYGPAAGGDVAELRLKSENTTATNAYAELRADWGWLDIRKTRITSWNNAASGPDTETELYGRAFVRVRSTLAPDGVTPRESRMDVVDSDIGYLGWNDSETYGLVWKVVATSATNLPPGRTIFDLVEVRGDVLNSRLHHNYFGMYTYGHFGGHWATNEVDHNVGYGIDPHDDSDNLVIEENNVHHNGLDGIIASARCDHGIMRNNHSWANGENGLMLHRASDDWVVEGNRSLQNGDSGIALFASSRTLVRNNVCLSNNNAGIRLSVGASDNIVTNNQFGWCTNGFRIYQDNDVPNPGDDGRPKRNLFENNWVHDYLDDAARLQNADANSVVSNSFTAAVATELRFETGTNNLVAGNSFPSNVLIRSIGTTNSSTFTTFTGQPQLKLQMDTFGAATFRDQGGAVFDFGQLRIPTPVYPTGSAMSVVRSNLGGTVTVFTRNLWVTLDSGSARVTPTAWTLTGNQTKSWTTELPAGTPSVRYRVGDLAAGARYSVSAGSPLGSFTASPDGIISFVFNNSTPSLPTNTSFTVALEGQNTAAPVLPPQSDRTVGPNTQMVVINTASDADSPPAALTYVLEARNLADNSITPNAMISNNGIISWIPTQAQVDTTNRFTTTVSDGFLAAVNSFLVVVMDISQPPGMTLRIELTSATTAVVSWPAPSPGWYLQQRDTLSAANWADATDTVSEVNGRNQATISLSGGTKFFRLIFR